MQSDREGGGEGEREGGGRAARLCADISIQHIHSAGGAEYLLFGRKIRLARKCLGGSFSGSQNKRMLNDVCRCG